MIAALAAAAGVYSTGLSLDAAEQGQLTDRFTNAVDQLDRAGADHLQARLGGIFSLERLARDSPPDHPTVVEVLTAFIRTTAHRPTAPTASAVTICPDQPVAPDVQAAHTVLGRRDTSHDQTAQLDLQGTCLRNAGLRDARFARVLLTGADLTGAILAGADLTDATLFYTNFTDAFLNATNFTGANARGADLTGAILVDAQSMTRRLSSTGLTTPNNIDLGIG